MKNNKHNEQTNMKYTATASHYPLGGDAPRLTLVQDEGQVWTFPLFSILFSKNGCTPRLGYNAIVLDGPGNRTVPAEGPIAFDSQRRADQSMLCLVMTEPGGMYRAMEQAFVTDSNGEKFTIAMAEQFSDEPPRADGFPYFLACRRDSLPGLGDKFSQKRNVK